MTPLTEDESLLRTKNAFCQVFKTTNPFDEPFVESVSQRSLLYPISFQLQQRELASIAAAIHAIGETDFYLSALERSTNSKLTQPYDWYIPIAQIDQYYSINGYLFLLENALYSTKGTWGIMISHEQHAIVGGSKLFLDTLMSYWPFSPAEQIANFLHDWKTNHEQLGANISWLPKLLAHIYGKQQAQYVMQEMDF